MRPNSERAWIAFRERVEALGGQVVETAWLGANKPHRCVCREGHECRPYPINIQKGVGICATCGRASRDKNVSLRAWREFRERVEALGGRVVESQWLGNGKPHRCVCREGHECAPIPNAIQQGCGICIKCGHVARVERINVIVWKQFRERVEALGGIVVEPQWLGSGKPHRCVCREGHECMPSPLNIQQGKGMCLRCVGRVFDCFYVVTNGSDVKLGITSGDPGPRLNDHFRIGFFNTLFLCPNLPDGLARFAETSILRELAERDYYPYSGNEWFRQDARDMILALTGKYLSDSFVRRWGDKIAA